MTAQSPGPADAPSFGRLLCWRHRAGVWVGGSPSIYLPLVRTYLWIAGRGGGPQPVTRKTEFVIEGYPRCANSFAVAASGAGLARWSSQAGTMEQ